MKALSTSLGPSPSFASPPAAATACRVSGTVTLDGEPLEKPSSNFPPNGRPSMGKTDSNGYYRLEKASGQTGVELVQQRPVHQP
ncbi:MAG: hypothetical protein R3C09_21665 [Pirellulaceae bacterium]